MSSDANASSQEQDEKFSDFKWYPNHLDRMRIVEPVFPQYVKFIQSCEDRELQEYLSEHVLVRVWHKYSAQHDLQLNPAIETLIHSNCAKTPHALGACSSCSPAEKKEKEERFSVEHLAICQAIQLQMFELIKCFKVEKGKGVFSSCSRQLVSENNLVLLAIRVKKEQTPICSLGAEAIAKLLHQEHVSHQLVLSSLPFLLKKDRVQRAINPPAATAPSKNNNNKKARRRRAKDAQKSKVQVQTIETRMPRLLSLLGNEKLSKLFDDTPIELITQLNLCELHHELEIDNPPIDSIDSKQISRRLQAIAARNPGNPLQSEQDSKQINRYLDKVATGLLEKLENPPKSEQEKSQIMNRYMEEMSANLFGKSVGKEESEQEEEEEEGEQQEVTLHEKAISDAKETLKILEQRGLTLREYRRCYKAFLTRHKQYFKLSDSEIEDSNKFTLSAMQHMVRLLVDPDNEPSMFGDVPDECLTEAHFCELNRQLEIERPPAHSIDPKELGQRMKTIDAQLKAKQAF